MSNDTHSSATEAIVMTRQWILFSADTGTMKSLRAQQKNAMHDDQSVQYCVSLDRLPYELWFKRDDTAP